MAKTNAKTSGKAATKGEILNTLADKTGLKRKDVAAVLEQLGQMIMQSLGRQGAGVFTLPGLLRFKVRERPATPAGERKNPFTGQMQWFEARPARRAVRALPMKALKSMV